MGPAHVNVQVDRCKQRGRVLKGVDEARDLLEATVGRYGAVVDEFSRDRGDVDDCQVFDDNSDVGLLRDGSRCLGNRNRGRSRQ